MVEPNDNNNNAGSLPADQAQDEQPANNQQDGAPQMTNAEVEASQKVIDERIAQD